MKTILVATDYSSAATNAVDYAANLAKATSAELVLFNVYRLSIHASNSMASATSIDHRFEQNQDKLEELTNDTAKRYGIKARWELTEGDTIGGLKSFTSAHLVDLVVMGIESNLLEYKLFGNTTTAAIRLMQFPLLVVPNDVQYTGIHKIMYAAESSYLKDDCELGFLKRFVKDFGVQLEVFHVLKDGSETESNAKLEQVMESILNDVEHTYRYVSNPKVGDGIKVGLEQFPADLLVMIPHKIGFFESLIKGSNTSQMTVKTRVPLLVIPNERAC